MIRLAIFAAACLVGSMAMNIIPVPNKPYYDLENAEDLFRDFVEKHEKSYSRKEYFERLEIFKKSLVNINRLNAESSGAVYAVNHFADLKPEELQQYRGIKLSNKKVVKLRAVFNSSLELPPSHDWRDYHAVTPVQNQGACNSCYIFTAIGNIEGQYAIKHQQCLVLSKQQALDCLCSGSCCSMGGYIEAVMQQFINRSSADGPMLEKDYPYQAREGVCHEDARKVAVHVTGGQSFDIRNEATLQQILYELGPLAVTIAVDSAFMDYTSGIHEKVDECTHVSHGVLLVGYGEENGKKYWIIKNSWGEEWGEKGYMRLVRGVNACLVGLNVTASATVA